MITRAKIEGFKCLRSVEVELEPLTVLVGPNASGKSSFLEALLLLGDVVRSFESSFGPTRSFSEVAWRSADTPATSWTLEIEPVDRSGTSAGYRLGIGGPEPHVLEEQIRYGGDVVVRSDGDNVYDAGGQRLSRSRPRRETAFAPDAVRALPGVEALRNYLTSARAFDLLPSALAEPSPVSPDLQLAPSGFGLASVLATIKLADTTRFQQIEDGLRTFAPTIESIVLRPTTVDGQAGHRLAFKLADHGWEIPAHHASAGVLLLLGYLTMVHTEQPPRLMVIEEPENGIHPRRLQSVIEQLRRLTRGEVGPPTQIVLTTHSPYLLDFVEPEEVVIFRKGDDGASTATPFTAAPHLAERLAEQQLGELWFNLGEERLANGGES